MYTYWLKASQVVHPAALLQGMGHVALIEAWDPTTHCGIDLRCFRFTSNLIMQFCEHVITQGHDPTSIVWVCDYPFEVDTVHMAVGFAMKNKKSSQTVNSTTQAVLDELAVMTDAQLLDTLIRSGIVDKNKKLMPAYQPQPDDEPIVDLKAENEALKAKLKETEDKLDKACRANFAGYPTGRHDVEEEMLALRNAEKNQRERVTDMRVLFGELLERFGITNDQSIVHDYCEIEEYKRTGVKPKNYKACAESAALLKQRITQVISDHKSRFLNLSSWVNHRIVAMLESPRMWGSLESVEMQILSLIEITYALNRPDLLRSNERLVLNKYQSFLTSNVPGILSNQYLFQVRDISIEEFVLHIRTFWCQLAKELNGYPTAT